MYQFLIHLSITTLSYVNKCTNSYMYVEVVWVPTHNANMEFPSTFSNIYCLPDTYYHNIIFIKFVCYNFDVLIPIFLKSI